MTLLTKGKRLAALYFCLGLLGAVSHPALSDELAEIHQRGKIQVAIDLGNPPFAMMDSSFQPTGSEVETAKLLAQDLGVAVDFMKVPTSGRIPFLVSGKADVVISTLSITPERLKVVDFSIPYSQSTIIVAAPKGVRIGSYKDLAGIAVAVTRGTVNDTKLTESTAGVQNVQIVRFEDDPTASAAVASGQFSVYATSRPLLQQLVKANPSLDIEEKFVAQSYPLGMAIRKGEPALTTWINDWIEANLANGKLIDIYQKFHGLKLDPQRLSEMDLPRQ